MPTDRVRDPGEGSTAPDALPTGPGETSPVWGGGRGGPRAGSGSRACLRPDRTARSDGAGLILAERRPRSQVRCFSPLLSLHSINTTSCENEFSNGPREELQRNVDLQIYMKPKYSASMSYPVEKAMVNVEEKTTNTQKWSQEVKVNMVFQNTPNPGFILEACNFHFTALPAYCLFDVLLFILC